MRQSRLRWVRWVVWGALLVLVMGWPAGALAHGGGTPRLTGVQAGPYHVYAWTLPDPWRVGKAHLSIAVTVPDGTDPANPNETPVMDAQVHVTFTPTKQPDHAITMKAEPSNLLGSYYEADTDLPFAENWQILIDIRGKEGQGTAQFALPVFPPQTINWPWVIACGVALIALVGITGMRSRLHAEPKPHRPPASHQA